MDIDQDLVVGWKRFGCTLIVLATSIVIWVPLFAYVWDWWML